jgi:DNA gyrase/topoisomerase IV subunit B
VRAVRRRGRLGRRLVQDGASTGETQAILPIRGKILNVEKARLGKILENKEIQALITAIGTGIGEEFDLEKARYHKIVMLMDADVDGAHIRTLVLTFLFRHMRELIEAGYVYIAQPPLYAIMPTGSKGKERKIRYDPSANDRALRGPDHRRAQPATDGGAASSPRSAASRGSGRWTPSSCGTPRWTPTPERCCR